MHTQVSGIALPTTPGFASIILTPRISLEYGPGSAASKVQSVYGTISMSWARILPGARAKGSSSGVRISVSLPKPATLNVDVVMLGAGNSNTSLAITEGGELVWQYGHYVPGVDGVHGVSLKGELISIFVSRGTFDFEINVSIVKKYR